MWEEKTVDKDILVTCKSGNRNVVQSIRITHQKKAFHRQRIPEPSCGRKETVDKDILATSRNGDRKIIQSIRITPDREIVRIN